MMVLANGTVRSVHTDAAFGEDRHTCVSQEEPASPPRQGELTHNGSFFNPKKDSVMPGIPAIIECSFSGVCALPHITLLVLPLCESVRCDVCVMEAAAVRRCFEAFVASL